jgi:hypothetical protein
MVSEITGSIVWCAMVQFQLCEPIFIRTFLRPLSPDPIFIRISEVAFFKKIPKFIRTALRHLKKKSQNLSKRVMRDLGVLSGVLGNGEPLAVLLNKRLQASSGGVMGTLSMFLK